MKPTFALLIGILTAALLLLGFFVGRAYEANQINYYSPVEKKSYSLSLPEEIELLSTNSTQPDTIVAWNKNDTLVFRYVVSERYWKKQCLKYCK